MCLPQQIDVNIYEKTGINFHEVKGSLGEKDMASAVTTTRADEQVLHRTFQ